MPEDTGYPTNLNLGPFGGYIGEVRRDPLFQARQLSERAPEVGNITRDIFGGIFGEGGTDFGGIATDLLGRLEGVTPGERQRTYRGIDEEAGRATSNLSNRLSTFGEMDPEQFSRVAGDIDVGRLRARGEADANFAGQDRDMMLNILRSLGPLMGAQQSARGDFGGVAMNLLRSAPTVLEPGRGTGIGTGFQSVGRQF